MLQKAHELGEQCLTLAQHVQDPILLQEVHRMLGLTAFFLGEPVMALRHLEQGLVLYETQQDHLQPFPSEMDRGGVCLSGMAWTLWILGYPEQAIMKSRDALTLAHELSHAYTLAFALHHDAVVRLSRREVSLAQKRIAAIIALAHEHSFAQWMAGGMFTSGWALVEQGAVEEGIVELKKAQAMWQAMGTDLAQTHIAVRLAEAYRRGGRAAEGLRVLEEALVIVHKSGEGYFEAEIYRLKGELLLQQVAEKEEEAEVCFHKALDVARRQKAKSLELRAAMSLTHLWRQQGKREEARHLLAEIYGWFTEGFNLPDILEAKALLNALH
jgi:predicted ATPase